MAQPRVIEGTREEVQEQLRAFPRGQRFRLTPLFQPEEDGATTQEPTRDESLEGRAGNFDSGDANLPKNAGRALPPQPSHKPPSPMGPAPDTKAQFKKLSGYGLFAHVPGGSEAFALEKQQELAREDNKFEPRP